MRNPILLLSIVLTMTLALGGCDILDRANQSVSPEQAQIVADEAQVKLDQANQIVTDLQQQLAIAKAAAQGSDSPQVKQAIASATDALAFATSQLPIIQSAVDSAKETAKKLKEDGGSKPLWLILALGALAIAPKVLTVFGGPIGTLAAPLATLISDSLWHITGTQAQKADDQKKADQALGLIHQVSLTNKLLKVVDPAVAAPLISQARNQQKNDGVYDTVHEVVRQVEDVSNLPSSV